MSEWRSTPGWAEAGSRVARELLTDLVGKATASGQDSWRGALGRAAAIAHPQTAERKTPYLSLLPSLTSYQWFALAEPSWNPEDKEVQAREQSQAGGEGRRRESRQRSHWEERKATACCNFISYEDTLHIIILVTK